MTKSIYRQVYFDPEAITHFWVYCEQHERLEQQTSKGGYFYQVSEDTPLHGPFHTREAALGDIDFSEVSA